MKILDQNKQFLNQTMFGGARQFGGAKSAEQIAAIDQAIASANTSEVVTGPETGVKVYFDAPGGTAAAHLSDELLGKMSEHFDASELHKRADGSIILSGEAERYVSGWYNEVAYAVGFLAAAPEGAAKLDMEQISGLKAITKIDFASKEIQRYQQAEDKNTLLSGWENHARGLANIDAAMNARMLQDSDFSGAVSIKEHFAYQLRKMGLEDSDENIGKMLAFFTDEKSEQIIKKSNVLEGAMSLKDQRKKQDLDIAAANEALPKIRAKIERSGAASIDKTDKKHLDLLHMDAKSIEKDLMRKNEKLAELAKALHVNKQTLRKAPEDEGLGGEFKGFGAALDSIEQGANIDGAKLADVASMSAQLSGEILGGMGVDSLI